MTSMNEYPSASKDRQTNGQQTDTGDNNNLQQYILCIGVKSVNVFNKVQVLQITVSKLLIYLLTL